MNREEYMKGEPLAPARIWIHPGGEYEWFRRGRERLSTVLAGLVLAAAAAVVGFMVGRLL